MFTNSNGTFFNCRGKKGGNWIEDEREGAILVQYYTAQREFDYGQYPQIAF